MVHKTKRHIRNHTKALTIAGVFLFFLSGIFVFGLMGEPAYSDSGVVYPDGSLTQTFQNCVGASCSSGHWAVLEEVTYDSTDYVYTGTSGSGGEEEEVSMTSITGVNDSVTQVVVSFQAYSQDGCNSTCDNIEVRIFIDGGYSTIQSVTLSSLDTLYTRTFFGPWTGDDDLRVELVRQVQGTGPASGRDDNVRVGRVYAAITYTPWVNSPPTVTSVDDGPDPVTTGNIITFTIVAEDPDVDDNAAIICKTNSISSSGGTPACAPGQTWSGPVGVGAGYQTNFSLPYTAQSANEGTSPNNYFAFVCDSLDGCSATNASSQGAFTVIPNLPPNLLAVSDGLDPITQGGTVQFDVFWDDPNGDSVKAIVCKTDAVNAGVNPTCPEGAWTGASPTTGTSPVNLLYATQPADVGTNSYYAFACDTSGVCSLASDPNQGTFTVTSNSPPTVTLTSDDPDPVTIGNVITFHIEAEDPEVDDTIAIVCKTNGVSSSGGVVSCSGATWAGPSAPAGYVTVFNLPYTAQSANEGTSPNNYFAFVCDSLDGCSATNASSQGAFDVTANQAPSVTSVAHFPLTTTVGSDVIFTVNLDDPNNDPVGVIICKDDQIASALGVVSCPGPGGSWGSAVYPGPVSQTSINYTTQPADEGANAYHAFACDNSNECSSPSDPNDGIFNVEAGLAGNNVSGYAWSSNIGWISFNCLNTDTCPTSNYGVDIDEATGDFSGYAWSSNIGWISFNRADTGNPPEAPFNGGSGPIARMSGGAITGWARALANGGGWDGWIKFACTGVACSTSNYGVVLNTTPDPDEFTGWAWGDIVVGWVSLNCSDQGVCLSTPYAVTLSGFNSPPQVVPGSPGTSFSATSGPSCISSERLIWDFTDNEDGSTQSAYHLQIYNDAGLSSIQFDSGIVASGAKERFVTISSTPINELADGVADGDGQLAFYQNRSLLYYWRIRVGDSGGTFSEWLNGPSFRTSLHPYPAPDFDWAPTNPSEGEEVQFTDLTTFFVLNPANRSWNWTIPGATYISGSSTSQNPRVIFDDNGARTVTLLTTDGELAADANSGNGQCSISQAINVDLPLPEFREIPPVGFNSYTLDNIFAFLRINGVFAYFN